MTTVIRSSKFQARVDQLRARRRKLNMPPYRLAELAGLSETAAARIEDPTWNPTLRTLKALEAVLFPPKGE